MSRCFPYPPPGYSGKRASNEALIESIELQREKEKVKPERKKEKKRENKEKRKEKTKLNPSEISCVDLKGGHNHKRKKDDVELLERSSLTEEHGQPVGSQNPCYSSDGTQNSNKRRKHSSPFNGSRSHGNIIRFRLPLKKHKEPDDSTGKEQPCSTPVRADLPAQRKYEVASGASRVNFCSTSLGTGIVAQGVPFRHDKEPSCSTSGRTKIIVPDNMQIDSGYTSFGNEIQRLNSLFENWVPTLLSELPDSDQEWLFRRKHQDSNGESRNKASSNISCCGSTLLWPRAQYLPEADIYALPYTIPF